MEVHLPTRAEARCAGTVEDGLADVGQANLAGRGVDDWTGVREEQGVAVVMYNNQI